jgi:hypothetical protein
MGKNFEPIDDVKEIVTFVPFTKTDAEYDILIEPKMSFELVTMRPLI